MTNEQSASIAKPHVHCSSSVNRSLTTSAVASKWEINSDPMTKTMTALMTLLSINLEDALMKILSINLEDRQDESYHRADGALGVMLRY